MVQLRHCLIVLLVASIYCDNDVDGSHKIKEEEGVLVVTNSNWNDTVNEGAQVLVEFYAPWCGHCQSLAPEYVKAAKMLKDEESEIRLAKVDATIEKELAEKYEVKGFPTIKFFKNGNIIDFAGGRTAADIVSWLKKKTGPPAKVLTTADELTTFTTLEGARDIVFVGTFKDAEGEAKKVFLNVAAAIEGTEFGIAVGEEDGIKCYKNFDNGVGGPISMTGDIASVDEIKDFVNSESVRLLTEFSDETAPKIFGGDIKNHMLAFVSKEAPDFTTHEAALLEAAKDFKGKILFVYINVDVAENERILEFFHLKKEDVPTVRIIDLSAEMRKYNPTTPGMAAADITAFATGFLAGELSAHLNSEDIPEDWDSKSVKVLVGKNFKEVVLDDKTKHVFIEFYAPWCGHCKQLAPIWDKVGDAVEADADLKSKVLIAKMDSTANEVEEAQVGSFPTLKCWTIEDKEHPVDYKGARTFEALKAFAESGCTKQEEAADTPEEDEGEEPEGDEHDHEHEGDDHEHGDEDEDHPEEGDDEEQTEGADTDASEEPPVPKEEL